jgi:hypothetical protein
LQFVVFGLVFYSREGRVIVSLSARRSVLPCPFLHGISFRFVYSAEQAEPGQFSVATLDLKSRSLGESFFLCRSFSWPASDLARARKDHQLHQGFSRLLRSSLRWFSSCPRASSSCLSASSLSVFVAFADSASVFSVVAAILLILIFRLIVDCYRLKPIYF